MKTIFALLCVIVGANAAQAAVISICGGGCNVASIQAAFDNYDLAPGDVVEIRDSRTYSEMIYWGTNDGGTNQNPVVLRAASGQFPIVNGGIFVSGLSYVQIGAVGQGTIIFEHPDTGWIDGAVALSNTAFSAVENTTIHNIYDGNGIILYNGAHHNIIQNNLVYDVGTSHLGDGSQGEGIIVYRSGTYNLVRNNTVHDSAHGNIGIYGTVGSPNLTMGNQVNENYINSGTGECISILASAHVLAEKNRCYNQMQVQTNLAKNAFQLTGSSYCSIRNNIIYNGHHYYAFEVSGYRSDNQTHDLWVYNNTIFEWGTSTNTSSDGNSGVYNGVSVSGARNFNNKYLNNLFWNINWRGQTGWYDISRLAVFYNDYGYGGDAVADWGNSLAEVQASACGGTAFRNNVIRSHGGNNYDPVWLYGSDAANRFRLEYSLAELHVNLPQCASGNIDVDPLFAANPLGNYGPNDTWWHLQRNSPVINAGVAVDDSNAAAGGWAQLTYAGAAPDIGAFESVGNTLSSPQNLRTR